MNFHSLRSLAFALFCLLSVSVSAQCLYTLEMQDAYGDGWNGGVVSITTGGNTTTFTLDNINDDGVDSTLTFNVINGAPLTISFSAGSFPWEVSFKIYDNTGQLFYEINYPPNGVLYSGTGLCISCSKPSDFAVENVWDNRARLRWKPSTINPNPVEGWRVIYGLQGFSVSAGEGDTLDVSVPKANILGLQKKTWYDAYVQQYCGVAGDYSELIGPISFQTYWTNDVGIAGVLAPQSSCDLGLDSVKVILKNYGSAPQSLVTFRYAVNGTNAPVVPPADGFYTGVLGKDSSVVIAFETLSDFSASGEYRIDVFTQLTNDEDISNDTFTYFVNNRLKPNYVQDFETWNGGWTPTGDSPSWEFGAPNKPSIPNAASGINAWVTSLTNNYNSGEKSYLESPCFDFSDVAFDPVIDFSLNRDLESTYDGVWLEMSLDGGQNWSKVGGMNQGLNWYTEENDLLNLGDVWSDNSGGWLHARHSLPNSAGQSEVHLRFAMSADPFVQYGGFGIDDVKILKPFNKDMAGISINTLGETAECGLEEDQISFTFNNFGSQTVTGFKVAYSINGAAPVINNVAGVFTIDQGTTYNFTVPFDSRDGKFEIKCWTILNGDQNPANDTVTYAINHLPNPVPFQENFEALTAPPANWTYDPSFGFSVTNTHNNISNVLAFNLYSGNPEFSATMPRYGIIQQGDSLRFTYRITNYSSQGTVATVLQSGSKIEIQVSTDCGENYTNLYTISAFNHAPAVAMKTLKLSLNAFVGQSIKIRFHGVWGASDFWVDIDNINLLSCPAEMDLAAELVPSTPGLSDGAATVNIGIGNPPYSFEWSNGSTDQTATGLAAGAYTVTVTDAFGCTDELSVNLGNSATQDPGDFAVVKLYPNPTGGLTTLEADFGHSTYALVEILNPLGQPVRNIVLSAADRIVQPLDLSDLANGLYLLRISAEGKTMTRKLLKNN